MGRQGSPHDWNAGGQAEPASDSYSSRADRTGSGDKEKTAGKPVDPRPAPADPTPPRPSSAQGSRSRPLVPEPPHPRSAASRSCDRRPTRPFKRHDDTPLRNRTQAQAPAGAGTRHRTGERWAIQVAPAPDGRQPELGTWTSGRHGRPGSPGAPRVRPASRPSHSRLRLHADSQHVGGEPELRRNAADFRIGSTSQPKSNRSPPGGPILHRHISVVPGGGKRLIRPTGARPVGRPVIAPAGVDSSCGHHRRAYGTQ